MNTLSGPLYVFAAIFLWSSIGVVVRLSGLPVHVLIFYSNLVSLFVLAPVVASRRYRARLPKGGAAFKALLLGPVLLLNTLTFFFALKNTSISNALMTHYIAPVVVAFLASVFLGEPLTWRVLLAIAVSTAGLWTMLDTGPLDLFSLFERPSLDTLGTMSGLFSGFAYAVLVLLVRVYAQGNDPMVLAFFQNVMVCLLLFPFVRVFPVQALWSFLIMGILHSTIAPVLYFKGLASTRASRAAVIGYMEPVCAVAFGMVFLNEYPAPHSLLGGAMIILSGFIVLTESDGSGPAKSTASRK